MKYTFSIILIFSVLPLLSQDCWTNAYKDITSFQIGREKLTLEKKLNFKDYRINPDGTKYYKTSLALVIHKNWRKIRRVLDNELYTSSDCSDGMLPCILIDTVKQLISVFANSKGPDLQYGMEGYGYTSDFSLKSFHRKTIFKKVNAGWFSFFGGSDQGEPELWHFSAAGYYAILSKQEKGVWKNYIISKVDPELVKIQYEMHANILYTSIPKVDRMILEKLETRTL